ncbi:uncharacterized protein YoxC [Evansella vedderi]|uniref:Uncharacterized protein YoxC n=1 Tax=Evansella vedderi TaxID=38282 RepID=A0ABT9ZW90_9BACI|nr:hypothetical protein [Evansella vedderi]MDQ0255493.1 uncharacterized protein YoxC [Evansella vedderi]
MREEKDSQLIEIEGAKNDSSAPFVDEKEERKRELEEKFKNDPLYPSVEKEHDIISDDILVLDPKKLYSTKDVVNILNKYDYLYDPIKGESFINENRIRWWLNEKEADNLIFYFNLEKPGRAWVWNVDSIVKAKIVAILRFVKNHQQKIIKYNASGVVPNTPSITESNIFDLMEKGNLNNIHDPSMMKDMFIASMMKVNDMFQGMEERYKDLHGAYESLKEENGDLKEQLKLIESGVENSTEQIETTKEMVKGLSESSSEAIKKHDEELAAYIKDYKDTKQTLEKTQERLEQLSKSSEETIKKRDEEFLSKLNEIKIRGELRKEALEEWDKQSLFKRIKSKEGDKEKFIYDYIDQHIKSYIDKIED